MRRVAGHERRAPRREGAGFQFRARPPGQRDIEVQVVQADEADAEDFVGPPKVADVGAAESVAGVAFAALFQRAGVGGELLVLDYNGGLYELTPNDGGLVNVSFPRRLRDRKSVV